MGNKTYTLILCGVGVLLLFIGGLLSWYIKPEKVCPAITDSVYVKGDTIKVPYPDTVLVWKEKQSAVYDSVNQEYEGYFDSSFVNNDDTILVDLAVVFAEKTKDFEIDMNIEHKDYEKIRVDTIKVNYVDIKEVEIDNPLWVWSTVIGGILLLVSIIFGG
jgi:hypothetical protein